MIPSRRWAGVPNGSNFASALRTKRTAQNDCRLTVGHLKKPCALTDKSCILRFQPRADRVVDTGMTGIRKLKGGSGDACPTTLAALRAVTPHLSKRALLARNNCYVRSPRLSEHHTGCGYGQPQFNFRAQVADPMRSTVSEGPRDVVSTRSNDPRRFGLDRRRDVRPTRPGRRLWPPRRTPRGDRRRSPRRVPGSRRSTAGTPIVD